MESIPVFKKRTKPVSLKSQTLEVEPDEETIELSKKPKVSKPNAMVQSTKDQTREKFEAFTHASNKSVVSSIHAQENATAVGFVDQNTTSTAAFSNGPVFVGKDFTAVADNKTIVAGDDAEQIELYTGLSSYKPKIQTGREKMKVGPTKLAANVRTMSRVDYQPDICKDYKETGYCGYGDACKFMHDRGDYKSGWEIDRDFKQEHDKERRKLEGGFVDLNDNSLEIKDELPFACLICREDFVNPVVTKCEHYFCEKCALKNYVKDTKCFACRQPTHGIFNTANNIIQKMKASREAPKETQENEKETTEIGNSGWAIP